MINENLLPNPSFASGTTGYTALASATISAISTDSFIGGSSLQITRSSSAATGVVSSLVAITAGETYTVSGYLKVPTGEDSSGVAAKITYYNSSSVATTNLISSTTTITAADGWVRVSATKASAAGDAYVSISLYQVASGTAGELLLADALKIENSISATQFSDNLTQAQETDAVHDSLRELSSGDIETRPYITGLKLEGDISINGLVLNTIDENKVVWICTDIDGWWTLPAPEVPNIPRGLDDGAYDVRGRWLPREITLQGSILPPKPSYAPAARQRLMKALDLVYTGGWLKVNEDPLMSAYVRVTGQPDVVSVNARGRIDFTVLLRAGDPVKYSWNPNATDGYVTSNVAINTVGGSLSNTTITNVGNTNTAPVFSLTGPMTAPAYIKNVTTGKTLKIVKDLRPNTTAANVTTKVRVSGVSTLTTDVAHKFLIGDVVTVAGMGSGGSDPHGQLNGDKTITATTATTISFADAGVNVLTAVLTSNVVTLTTDVAHNFSTGSVYVSNLGSPFDGTYTIASASGTSITYAKVSANTAVKYEGLVSLDISSASDAGTATLKSADTLQIDMYNTTVLYRGLPDSARSTIDAGVDWIKLNPGVNSLRLEKSNASVTPASFTVKYKSGWIG